MYPKWQTFQDNEVERTSNALQIQWCRSLVRHLDRDNDLNEVEYSKAEEFADSWTEKVFSDHSSLIDK